MGISEYPINPAVMSAPTLVSLPWMVFHIHNNYSMMFK